MLIPKYPDIQVQLSGNDGNAISIIGLCRKEARAAKLDSTEFEVFVTEALSGNYNHLLQTCMKWFDVN